MTRAEAKLVLDSLTTWEGEERMITVEHVEAIRVLSQEPYLSNNLEEAAEEYRRESYSKSVLPNIDGPMPEYGGGIKDAFIAGAEWQKEQDQPITGNSLEQEWLRYVDRRKKECGGELPALGEYGWLQIARHFAEWQKSQMLKGAVEGEAEELYNDGESQCVISVGTYFKPGENVYVIKAEEE